MPRVASGPPTRGYVIFTCSYTPNSAGISCLYRLCDELNRRGYPSFMTGGKETASHLQAPLLDTAVAEEICAQGYTAIYPETIPGNPLQAPSVIRWVLNRPGLLGGDEVYPESERVFYYSDVFRPYIKNRVIGKLYMPTIDESLFYCDDPDLSNRSLECFYIGKSQWQDGIVDRTRAFEITRDTPRKQELGKLFRASRVLYCFDNSTILTYEALLCGCPVVIVPDGTQTKQDYERLELGIEGIAWGPAELTDERAPVERLRARYDALKRAYHGQLQKLIDTTPEATLATPPQDINGHGLVPLATAWQHDPLRACKALPRQIKSIGRNTERALRRWRKALLRRFFGPPPEIERDSAEDGLFCCPDRDLSRRKLECFYLGKSHWRDGICDRTTTFEIAPETPREQLATLLKASRMLYSFDPNSPLVRQALKCGCPVATIPLSRGKATFAMPEPVDACAANQTASTQRRHGQLAT